MGSGFQSLTRPPQVDYAVRGVQPPAALAVSTSDQIVIKVHNSNAAPGLQLFYRLLLADGTIVPGQQALPADATRAVNTFTLGLDDGFLLSAVVFSTATGLTRGQCYVRVLVFRGSLTQLFVGHLLAEGYVTTATAIGFPIGPNEYAFSGHGVLRSITGTVPAAGAEITETVPTGAIWRIISFRYTLVAAGGGGVRTLYILYTDGTNTLIKFLANMTLAGGATATVNWCEGGAFNNFSAPDALSSLPIQRFLPAGFKIGTSTAAFQAGDQYSAPQYLVEEWIQP